MRPAGLKTEYTTDPTGLDVEAPRLSWELRSTDRDASQTAYRIRAASSREALRDGKADRWDTEKVDSDRSVQIPYEGTELTSGDRVFWTVRVWDDADEPSPWSEPASWEMGLLPDDWRAEWIASDGTSNREQIREHEWQWTDYTVTVEVSAANAFGALLRVRDSDNYYLVRVETGSNADPEIRLRVREHGQVRTLETNSLAAETFGETARLEVTVDGDELTVRLDGTTVLEAVDDTHDGGRIGVTAPGSMPASVHELIATDLDGRTFYADDFTRPDATAANYSVGTVHDGALHVNGSDPVLVHVFRPDVAPAPLLRTDAHLDGTVVDARAYVSGLGFYELSINGERVGDQVLAPERTNYDGVVPYATHDVTEMLRSGENVIGVELGRARFGAPPPTIVNWHRASWWSDPKLRFQLEVTFADGTTRTVVSDDSWLVTDGPTRFDSLLVGEAYDARRERDGWTEPGYAVRGSNPDSRTGSNAQRPGDDANWQSAHVVAGPDGDIQAQLVDPIEITDEIEPVAVEEPVPGTYVYDFGRQVVGRPQLTVEGDRGADVRLKAGEKRAEDGTVYARSPYRDAEIQEDTYVLSGDGVETWHPRFTYHGFRYVQLTGVGTPDDPGGVLTAAEFHTPVEASAESDFTCDSDLFESIHERCRRALLNNLHSVPTDTPVYEKRGWTGDALLTEEMAMYNFWPPRFDTKRLRDLRAEVRLDEEDHVPAVVPSSKDADEDPNLGQEPILGWQAEYPLLARWLHEYYGDERVLEDHYDELTAFVEYVRREARDGLVVETGLGDWVPPNQDSAHPPEGPAILGTAFFYKTVRSLVRIAEQCGRQTDADGFRELAADVYTAFNETFFDPGTTSYRTGETDEYRQTSNVLPLAFGLVPDDHRERVLERLVEDVRNNHDGHLNTGVFGTKYLLPVLSESGYHDLATTVASQRTYPSWGHMLEHGATALWESWGEDTRSLNHHFLGTIDEWFYQYVAGVREPLEPGFERVHVAPEVNDPGHEHALEWARARVDTIHGPVISRWERAVDRAVGGLRLEVTIPANTDGLVEIPMLDSDTVRVAEGGQQIWDGDAAAADLPPGVASVERDGARVVVAIGSGEYTFELTPLDDESG